MCLSHVVVSSKQLMSGIANVGKDTSCHNHSVFVLTHMQAFPIVSSLVISIAMYMQ
jgi:hypothetical protein